MWKGEILLNLYPDLLPKCASNAWQQTPALLPSPAAAALWNLMIEWDARNQGVGLFKVLSGFI